PPEACSCDFDATNFVSFCFGLISLDVAFCFNTVSEQAIKPQFQPNSGIIATLEHLLGLKALHDSERGCGKSIPAQKSSRILLASPSSGTRVRTGIRGG